jgi:hypothetical protein
MLALIIVCDIVAIDTTISKVKLKTFIISIILSFIISLLYSTSNHFYPPQLFIHNCNCIVSRFVFTTFESKIDYNLAIFNHYLEAFKKLNLSNIVTESIFEKILLIFIKENISKYITNFGKDNLVSNATYEMEPMNSDKIKFQTLDDIQDIFSRKTLFKITTSFNNT